MNNQLVTDITPATERPEPVRVAFMVWESMQENGGASETATSICQYIQKLESALSATREQAIRECVENRWQSIETAPKDGTPILAFGPEPVTSPDYGARETFWRFYGKGSIAYEQFKKGEGPSGAWHWCEPIHNWSSSWKPTHWQPLPTPPLIERGSK